MDETDARAVPHEADNVFELGLTLAGAISAGAYTAGVLDFLFQALDEWEKHRGVSSTPQHRVVIKVITGASAGAITGALGPVALARGLHPVSMRQEATQRVLSLISLANATLSLRVAGNVAHLGGVA